LETIKQADRVESYGLQPQRDHTHYKSLQNYATRGSAIPVPRQMSSRLAATLLAPDSYRWDSAVACIPNYGLRVTFYRGNERVDVLVCLECGVLQVYRNEQHVGGSVFDAHNALAKAAMDIFTQDPEAQKLRMQPERDAEANGD
jgi:hypothetical protein